MRKRTLAKLYLVSLGIYVLVVLRGLGNSHYLDWPLEWQIGDTLEFPLLTLPLTYFALRWLSRKEDYFRDSLWFAFFVTVPFAVYDFAYLGLFKGYGLNYLRVHWFLTIFYFVTPIEIPIIGYLMQKNDPAVEKKHVMMFLVAVFAWLLNWWEGLPSGHYLDWTVNMKVTRLTNIVLILAPITHFILRFTSTKADSLKNACLLALYLSGIFLLFDVLYLGISRNFGMGYVRSFWFVALFYPLFWIELPLIGWFTKLGER